MIQQSYSCATYQYELMSAFWKDIHTLSYSMELTIHSSQDVETTQISFDKWTDKMRYIHITENCLALKTSEICHLQ